MDTWSASSGDSWSIDTTKEEAAKNSSTCEPGITTWTRGKSKSKGNHETIWYWELRGITRGIQLAGIFAQYATTTNDKRTEQVIMVTLTQHWPHTNMGAWLCIALMLMMTPYMRTIWESKQKRKNWRMLNNNGISSKRKRRVISGRYSSEKINVTCIVHIHVCIVAVSNYVKVFHAHYQWTMISKK
jgi:hypothetical protein